MKHTEIFTATDVHKCYPWVASTTLFNRIHAGLIPVSRRAEGTGDRYEFSLAGLVHVGVVDELLSIGVWKAATPGTTTEIDFIPARDVGPYFERAGGATVHERALAFYDLHRFSCRIFLNVHHYTTASGGSRRRKRASRTLYLVFHADPNQFPDVGEPIPSRFGISADSMGFVCFSHAMIDVSMIYSHVAHTLGL